jgi:hypothetical protein
MKTKLILGAVLAAGSLHLPAQSSLTYLDLIQRLTDLESLAALPVPGETCTQWSSYDRRSRYDETTGKYVGWDANGDGTGFIRKEGDHQVFAEMQGPGCIWRIWSADARQGKVKIFLDGATEPVVDLPFIGYFNNQNDPFTRTALVHTVARGLNNYIPIPYQKSCKIIAETNWGRYFQFVYATYPKGTQVPTFKRQLSQAENTALDRANQRLQADGLASTSHHDAEQVVNQTITIAPGQKVRLAKLTGQRAITSLRVKPELPPSPQDYNTLRELALSIKWDGETEPSVWSPLGDFFGTSAGANAYRSLPLGLLADGWWYSHWYMPFAQSAEVELTNDGPESRKVAFEITHAPVTRPMEQLGRFHAKWHRDAFLPAEPERKIDWTMLQTEGRGRFLGVLLHVWNPRGKWWGEGDEKFFVDGEKFPSTIGTGSEDYFGYAWCDPTLFQNCYHNQTISMRNKGHIAVNRWHITDNVPFQKNFNAAIEKYFPNERPALYASTVYWYLAPGGKDPYAPCPVTERVGYWTPVKTATVAGALEGESLKILSKTAGKTQEQDMDRYNSEWSGAAQVWWTLAKPGDRLDIALPVAKTGRYTVSLQLTKARDYGIVQLSLDGQNLGQPIDLYNPEVVPSGTLKFGEHELSAGEHKLSVTIQGANPAALKAYMFGLDFVALETVK